MIEDIEGEEWVPVMGFEGVYDVSSEGRIATYRDIHNKIQPTRQRLMRLGRELSGYLHVTLKRKGLSRQCRVHRLVLEAFVGPCPEGTEACHGNGVKHDNRIVNLKWDTHRENQMQMHRDSPSSILFSAGKANPAAKLSDKDVLAVRALSETGRFSFGQIAKMFSVKRRQIGRILDGTRRARG